MHTFYGTFTKQSFHVVGPSFENDRVQLAGTARIDNKTRPEVDDLAYLANRYTEEGITFFESLLGDFAFVLYDKQKQSLFCVKDQLGIRPLFYSQVEETLYFASSIPLLRQQLPFKPSVNQEYVKTQLTHVSLPVEETFFKEITRLKPAHFLQIDANGKVQLNRYWDLTPVDLSSYGSEEQLFKILKETMEEAIRCRLPQNGNTGAQLSGGLDSSAISVVISRIQPREKLFTYSFVLSDKTRPLSHSGIDEQKTQQAVMAFAGLLPENHRPIDSFYYRDVLHELAVRDQVMGGLADSDCIWQDTIFKRAAADGVTTLFSGFPGDECISQPGGNYMYDALENRDFQKVYSLNDKKLIRTLRSFNSYYWRKLLKRSGGKLRQAQKSRNLLRKEIPVRYQSQNETPSFRQKMKDRIARTHTCLRTESEGLYAAQYGITTVYPLADLRLVRLVYSLPEAMFKPRGYNRRIFRDLCKDLLPEQVRTQPKFSGATTLAFADIWTNNKKQEYDRLLTLDDPLNYYISQRQMEKQSAGEELKINRLWTRLYEIDYFLKKYL